MENTMRRASSPTSNSAGQTRLPTFSMTTTSRSPSGRRGQRRAHHRSVEVALAAEAVGGVDQRHGDAGGGETVGVDGGLDVAFDHAEAGHGAGVLEHLGEQGRLAGTR
jgi:hypothetical protein